MESISEIYRAAGSKVRFFDMSRGIKKISQKGFEHFEKGKQAYPYPFAGKAMIAICSLSPLGDGSLRSRFLQFPLNSRGFIEEGALQRHLAYEFEKTHRRLFSEDEPPTSYFDGPYSWKPTLGEAFMVFAAGRYDMRLPACPEYAVVRSKIANGACDIKKLISTIELSEDFSWLDDIGLPEQGLAELVTRINEADNQELLIGLISELPYHAYISLCAFLSQQELPKKIVTALLGRHYAILARMATDDSDVIPLLYSLTRTPLYPEVIAFANTVLTRKHVGNPNTLAALSRYLPYLLLEPAFHTITYIDKLAANPLGETLFCPVFLDLVSLLGREPLLSAEAIASYAPRTQQVVKRMSGV